LIERQLAASILSFTKETYVSHWSLRSESHLLFCGRFTDFSSLRNILAPASNDPPKLKKGSLEMTSLGKNSILSALARLLGLILLTAVGSGAVFAQNGSAYFSPGNLVVSRSLYVDTGSITAGVTVLPPNCSPANCPTPVTAVVSSAYPYIFNNDTVDGNFGITSKIFLDQITPTGTLVASLEVPNSSQNGVPPTKDQVVTSFSSKSELALNLSTDGNSLTFMGYFAPIGAIDASNSNTPSEIDPTVAPGNNYYRSVAQVDQKGKFRITLTNAYTGDNGRAAILNNSLGANLVYMAGNAGNGTQNPQPVGVIISTGAQMLTPEVKAEVAQNPGTPTAVGSFNIVQLPANTKTDKIGKDTNFRGLTISNNVLYYTKGSGGNGINTVYFVDTTGSVCTDTNGVGLPVPGASLPTSPLSYDPSATVIQTDGLKPYNMCVLKGLPTVLAKENTASFPFGIWFANSTTLYVADEGSGNNGGGTGPGFYAPALPANNPTAGLQKWIFNEAAGEWQLAYILTNGLNLGSPYAYAITGYPTGNNSGAGGSGSPWQPANDGLRNITGVVNGDGTVTVYASTSTISGNGDQGADPNQLVAITDTLSAGGPTPPAGENFTIIRKAGYGEVLRGVALAPGTTKH
jgi:hypothetical protein